MPDTFAHLGVQALASRGLFRDADIKWIAVGCVIPDIPWIVQRAFLALRLPVDPYDLRYYAIVQASLFFCLLLAGALALLGKDSRRLFLLLALNSFLHLFLDALQIKWANGVHFFAPFCWQVTSFGLFWPDQAVSLLLTLGGVAALIYFGLRDRLRPLPFAAPGRRHAAALLLLAAYFTLPPLFTAGPAQEDNHYADTLSAVAKRPGRYIELDRAIFRSRDSSIYLLNGERVRLTGPIPGKDTLVSVQGRFTDTGTIHVSAFHVHSPLRDLSTKAALAAIVLLWLVAIAGKRITVHTNSATTASDNVEKPSTPIVRPCDSCKP